MEFAFFNPVQLMIVLAILLILFGPQKMPEIGAQLGRALRELKRSTQELTDALHGNDDPHHAPYEPPRYDDTSSYGTDYNNNSYNGYNSYNDGYNASGNSTQTPTTWETYQPEGGASASTGSVEPERGDFASPALADAAPEIHAASGSVPRSRA